MGRTPGAITYRRAIDTIERIHLALLRLAEQQEAMRAELATLIAEVAAITRHDDGRSR